MSLHSYRPIGFALSTLPALSCSQPLCALLQNVLPQRTSLWRTGQSLALPLQSLSTPHITELQCEPCSLAQVRLDLPHGVLSKLQEPSRVLQFDIISEDLV